MKRPGLRVLLLAAASVAASLLVAELLLRLMEKEPPYARWRADPRWLYSLEPGTSMVFQHREADGGGQVIVEINSLGYRGPELLSAGSRRRMVVYGDSFAEAETTPVEETFVVRLGERLASSLGVPVEPVNAGVVGYGPDQVSLRMEVELDTLAPDLVVVVLFAGNDFGDLLRDRLLGLDAQGTLRRLPPPDTAELTAVISGRTSGSALLRRSRTGWRTLRGRLQERSADPAGIADLTWDRMYGSVLTRLEHDYQEAVVMGDRQVSNPLYDYYDLDVSLTPQAASAQYKVALMEQVMLRIAELARAHSTPLMLVIVPAAIDLDDARGFREIAARRYPDYRPDRSTSVLAEIARRHDLPHLDLFPAFAASGGATLYFTHDSHWNSAGQDLAAGLVQQAVQDAGLLDWAP